MSYRYHEIHGRTFKLSEMPENEQAYIRKEWERLCARESVNSSECVFFQKPNGRFFKALRCRIAANRYQGSAGGYWIVRYGDCKRWAFKKNVMGQYDPEPVDKYFSALVKDNGERIEIPGSVHTKKEALALAKELGFEF